jgi:nucleoside 2-deoxyribosyltransferase
MANSVYVASPLGFTLAGRRLLQQVVIPGLQDRGYTVLDPWVEGDRIFNGILSEPVTTRSRGSILERAAQAGARNAEMIRESDAVLAILDDCDLDSGTCAEIGYAAALPRPIIGVRTDFRLCGDFPEIPINLQVMFFIESSGGRFVEWTKPDDAGMEVAFDALMRLLREDRWAAARQNSASLWRTPVFSVAT